jgi:argininosuccinate lyase
MDVYSVLGAVASVKSRRSLGGTAPENVRRQARKWLKRLAKEARSEGGAETGA